MNDEMPTLSELYEQYEVESLDELLAIIRPAGRESEVRNG